MRVKKGMFQFARIEKVKEKAGRDMIIYKNRYNRCWRMRIEEQQA